MKYLSSAYLVLDITTDGRKCFADKFRELCGKLHVFKQELWDLEYLVVVLDEFLSYLSVASNFAHKNIEGTMTCSSVSLTYAVRLGDNTHAVRRL